ncbi:MAG: peptidoglycan bridge formation glycyltransferase FemA/FemB family protein [bacterium]|nr:peptidoglycan bridge formation glycyltransferase FemA/FemB family protein [bacterium]
MEIKGITNKEEWEGFLAECEEKTFLHSWQWGEFQRLMREKVWRYGLYEGSDLRGVALIVKVAAKRGTFLLVPHGPVAKIPQKEMIGTLLLLLKNLAKEEGASFIRINPVWERTKENTAIFKNLGFKRAPAQMHPEASWKLNLLIPEDQLFSAMRKTTRYLVRQAMKNPDIALEQSGSSGDVATFSAMHEQVSQRQAFTPFSREYLENEFAVFSKDNQVQLFFAKYKGEIAAASFVVFWSGIGFYHHAASLPQYAKYSIPYLLQWEAIREARKRGCRIYDFWGYVDPKTQPSHPWAGPTLFKQGFGGEAHLYVKTQD